MQNFCINIVNRLSYLTVRKRIKPCTMSWHSWQNLPILLYRQFIKFQQCIVLEIIHTSTMKGKRNSEGRGSKRRQFPRGVGWLLKVFFLGAPRLVSYQKLPAEPLLSKLQCTSYFTFKRRLTVFTDDLFLMGIPNQVGKKSQKFQGGGNSRGWGV